VELARDRATKEFAETLDNKSW